MAADRIETLAKLYGDAVRELRERAVSRLVKDQRKLTSEALRARMLLAELEQIIEQLDEKVAQWIAENAPDIYRESISATDRRLVEAGIDLTANASLRPLVHQQALQVLVNSMQDSFEQLGQDLLRGMRHTIRRTQLSAVLDQEVKRQVGLGIFEGKARREVSMAIRERLISEFADRPFRVGGATFTAENYAAMVARTMGAEAATAGTVNRLVELGQDLVQISDSGATDACGLYEGKVLSISGESDKYPALSSLPNGGPPFHPNCTHAVLPFIEELASPKEIKDAVGIPASALGKSFREVNKGRAAQAA